MAMENNSIQSGQKENNGMHSEKRRTLLKALAGIPVLGVFGLELFRKRTYDVDKKNRILRNLGLDNLTVPQLSPGVKGDQLRVGIIGFGSRAAAHANGLGYMHPDDVQKRMTNGSI